MRHLWIGRVAAVTLALLALVLFASLASGQTPTPDPNFVGPLCENTPTPTPTHHHYTKTPTRTPTPTNPPPTWTPTSTPTATPTPTNPPPTRTPTRRPPTHTPTPYTTPTETPVPTVTPTPTPTPECGDACIPGFIKVGSYFYVPQLAADIQWKVEKILPSGWVLLIEQGGDGRQVWIQLERIVSLYPVYLVAVE